MAMTQHLGQLNFVDSKAPDESLITVEEDPVTREAMRRYKSDFGVTNCTFTHSSQWA
jgi:hypothetical protein